MNILIKKNRKTIGEICNKYKVINLYLFGSAISNEFNPKHSDIDLAVLFSVEIPVEDMAEHYFGLIEELELLLNKPIDLVTLKSVLLVSLVISYLS